MFIITGYLVVIIDDDEGVFIATFDIGGDRMLTIRHISRDDAKTLAPYLMRPVCVSWAGDKVHVVEAGEFGRADLPEWGGMVETFRLMSTDANEMRIEPPCNGPVDGRCPEHATVDETCKGCTVLEDQNDV